MPSLSKSSAVSLLSFSGYTTQTVYDVVNCPHQTSLKIITEEDRWRTSYFLLGFAASFFSGFISGLTVFV
jgi:hypothetical protein